MAVAFVTGGSLGAAKASVSSFVTSTISASVGDLVVVAVSANGSVAFTPGCTCADPQLNPYTQVNRATATAGSYTLFAGVITSALVAQALTVVFGSTVTAYSGVYARFTGATATIDGAAAHGASGTALSITPNAGSELAIGIGAANTATATNYAASTSFTEAGEFASTGGATGSNADCSLQYQLLPSGLAAVSFNPTATTAGSIGLVLLTAAQPAAPLVAEQLHHRTPVTGVRGRLSRGRF